MDWNAVLTGLAGSAHLASCLRLDGHAGLRMPSLAWSAGPGLAGSSPTWPAAWAWLGQRALAWLAPGRLGLAGLAGLRMPNLAWSAGFGWAGCAQ